jgi:hypothetical protein
MYVCSVVEMKEYNFCQNINLEKNEKIDYPENFRLLDSPGLQVLAVKKVLASGI